MKYHAQIGASLIEVLVAILILSFGMLSLGTMLSYSVQAPKLAGYRATAVNLASSHIERIRVNSGGDYNVLLSYDGNSDEIEKAECSHPDCNVATLVSMDNAATKRAIRQELPAGGMQVTCGGASCSSGDLWVIWQEPAALEASAGESPTVLDNCPASLIDFIDPQPRCLYVRFTI